MDPAEPGLLARAEGPYSKILAASTDGVVVSRFADGVVVDVNENASKTLGYPREELVGARTADLGLWVDPADRAQLGSDLRDGSFSGPRETRFRARSGEVLWIQYSVHVIEVDGETLALLVGRDVTEQRRLERDLRRSHAQLEEVFESVPAGFIAVDAGGAIAFANSESERLLGVKREELAGLSLRGEFPARIGQEFCDALDTAVAEQRVVEIESFHAPTGQWVEAHFWPTEDGLSIYFRDVSERKRAERQLEQRARQLAAVATLGERALEGGDTQALIEQGVELARDVLEVDFSKLAELQEGMLVVQAGAGWADTDFARLPGGRASQAGYALEIGRAVVVEDLAAETAFEPSPLLSAHGVTSGITVLIGGGRREPSGVLSVHTVERRTFDQHEVTFLQSVANVLADAVERQRSEDAIRHQALHDPLTGLPNRTLFLDRLAHALRRSRRARTHMAVLFVDLDHFKVVNDSLGHECGDELLKALAPRLEGSLRPGDTIARFGGDEFVVLCENLSSERDAVHLAERLAQTFSEPVPMGEDHHFATASIGVAVATERHERAESLIRDADAAMYRAKARGRARYELFDDDMHSRAVSRLRTENALRGALGRGELSLHYQPIVALEGLVVRGCEALLRWRQSNGEWTPPSESIAVAEESGLILSIGRWVIEEACREAAGWPAPAGGSPPPVYVNVSARQVLHPEFLSVVLGAVERGGIHPGRLRLEITETLLMEDAAPLETLRAVSAAGVSLVLDDFGRGYSSLSYLKRFPIDELKIDRSFIDGLASEPEDAAIVAAIVAMGRALGIGAVAEGVETEEQARALRALGCDLAQGYLFARPVPAAEVGGLLVEGMGAPAAP